MVDGSIVPFGGFLSQFGFVSDPFEYTNSDDEPLLADYFVPPPYFPTVVGDPSAPKSHIVLAPRGTGKTAQRLMIEADSEESGAYLCVTYDTFDQPPGLVADGATWAYHMNQVCRLVLMGLLVRIEEDPAVVDSLTIQQKRVLKVAIQRFLGSLSYAWG